MIPNWEKELEKEWKKEPVISIMTKNLIIISKMMFVILMLTMFGIGVIIS